MRKTAFLATLGVGLLSSLAAIAADLPSRKTPAYTFVSEPPFTWTGLYVGVNGGYATGKPTVSNGAASANLGTLNGGTFGGTIGANFQLANVVVGLEGDLNWANLSSTTTLGALAAKNQVTAYGTARVRLGYAFDNLMPYVTGGAYWQSVRFDAPGIVNNRDNSVGWTVGGGVEYALSHDWSVKGEYLYANVGKANFSQVGALPSLTTDGHEHIFRTGLNYRF